MIIAIDNETGIAYYGETMTALAKIIGITSRSISNWKKNKGKNYENGNYEDYNRFRVHFDCRPLKAKTGFANYSKHIFTLTHT